MQHQPPIAPQQARRIDAKREVAADACLRVVRRHRLGVRIVPLRFHRIPSRILQDRPRISLNYETNPILARAGLRKHLACQGFANAQTDMPRAKTNPIQTQYEPNSKPKQTQFKANPNPIRSQFIP
ncbi:MAG TPA: hypothetical protein QF630_03975 [Alphaproteobacteria bacterium]|nr:hypothetical protein [Alphaproteobacteria bacterium]